MGEFEEMGGTIRGQVAVGPVQMGRDGDTLYTGWVSGRVCIMNTGIVVIICRIIVVFSKIAFQVLGVVRLELGVGEPKPGVLDEPGGILGRVVLVIAIVGVNYRRSVVR
jgi:hypothetical protein